MVYPIVPLPPHLPIRRISALATGPRRLYTGLHIEKEMFFGPRATKEFWVLSITEGADTVRYFFLLDPKRKMEYWYQPLRHRF